MAHEARCAPEMRGGSVFERVYKTIRADILAGRFAPGSRLEPAAVAEHVHASLTPVRDALHRLTGERLVEQNAQDGFRLPMLREPGLRDLYRWQQTLVLLAVDTRTLADIPSAQECDAAALFLTLADQSSLAELTPSMHIILDRLAPIRCLEEDVLGSLSQEQVELGTTIQGSNKAAARQAIRRYHQWRLLHVEPLVEASYRAHKPRNLHY